MSLSDEYRTIHCSKDRVRRLSKTRIDQMYYLTTQEKERKVIVKTSWG